MKKTIIGDKESIQKTIEGIHEAATIIGSTLGPKGHNVMIRQANGPVKIINDGISILSILDSEDKNKAAGIALVTEASKTANSISGDGSSSTVLLTSEILKAYDRHENKSDLTSLQDKVGMEKAEEIIQNKIAEKAAKIEVDQYAKVANVSLGGNYPEIANLIAEAFQKVGQSGGVVIQRSLTNKIYLDLIDGMSLEHGVYSNYFVMNQKSSEIDYDNPIILLANHKVAAIEDIVDAFQLAYTAKRPFVLLCRECDGDCLRFLITNKVQQGIQCCVVKVPGYGDGRHETFEDLCTCLNKVRFNPQTQQFDELDEQAEFYEYELAGGKSISEWGPTHLTTCKHMTIKNHNTVLTFNDNHGRKKAQIEKLQALLDSENVILDHDRERLEARISKLSGVATLYLASTSDVELEELKLRVEDAVNSTRSAIKDGVVCGAGVPFMQIQEEMNNEYDSNDNAGFCAVVESLSSIFTTIHKNSSLKDLSDLKEKILQPEYAYNAETDEIEYAENTGVLDSAAVLKSSLKAAVSVAKQIITSGYTVNIYDDGVQATTRINPNYQPSMQPV